MKHNDEPLDGLNIALCLVAGLKEENGAIVFEPIAAFAGAGADFTNLTRERNIALAASLDAYAAANGIQRSSKTTNSGGNAVFTGLSAGLYLVAQADNKNSEYIIAPYLVAVPVPNETGSGWNHNVISQPKTEPVKRDNKSISVSVYKVWVGAENMPIGILVQLYRNGVPHGNCVVLNAGNNWAHTWNNLNPDGVWTVDELNVPKGYTKKITGSAASGFVITNTRDSDAPQQILVSGQKTWEHGRNPVAQQPQLIVLRLYADGALILQKQVGQAENWSWSIRLDKYDKSGKAIVYTIDEAPISGYTKTVNGYNLCNVHDSHTPSSSTQPASGPGGSPQTGDDSNLGLWLSVMGLSFIGLASLIVILAKKNEKQEKISFG